MKARIRNLFYCLGIVLFISLSIFSETDMDITGRWDGAIHLPGQELDIIVNFKNSQEGYISIPAQGAENLGLIEIEIIEDEIEFMIEDIPGDPRFKGKISENFEEIEGAFFQGGMEFSFQLERYEIRSANIQELLKGFEEIIEKGMEGLKVPGIAIAIVKNNEIILAEGYGYRDLDNKKPMTENTILAIGSSSKAFTTFIMGKLVEENIMEWDKPLRNYIPWFSLYDKQAGDRLSPRDLITHRSGLPRHDLLWYNNNEITREEIVRRLAYLPPNADLREKWQYNNLMYLAAGYLIEKLTDKTWEDAVREIIFDPLEMERSNFSVLDSQKDDDFAYPYSEDDGEIKKIAFRDISRIGPAGSINSSVQEMANWLIVHTNRGIFENDQIISGAILNDMHAVHMAIGQPSHNPHYTSPDYGLGWFVDTYRGERRVHHGGNIDGFSAQVSFLPGKNIGIVAIANKNATQLPELLSRTAYDLLLEKDPIDWVTEAIEEQLEFGDIYSEARERIITRRKENTRPAHLLRSYAGIYKHPGYGELEIKFEGTDLLFVYNDIETPLKHWHYETFNGQRSEDPTFTDFKITFITSVNGNVSELRAFFEPTLDKEQVFYKMPDPKYYDPSYLEKLTGKYELPPQTANVSLSGDRLMLSLPGQPIFELVPKVGDEFYLKEAPFVSLWFIKDDKGIFNAFAVEQYGGVFEFKRIEEEN